MGKENDNAGADNKGSSHTSPTPTTPGPQKQANPVVQLGRNAAGHLKGETFRRDQADRLGILDHCQPFTRGASDRAVCSGQTNTR